MVPSALRTLSVVTLLSAVSGTVFLISDHSSGSTSTASMSSAGGGALASAALTADLTPEAPARPASDVQSPARPASNVQSPAEAVAQHRSAVDEAARTVAEVTARKKARAEAAAEVRAAAAAAKAEAAAQRRREQVRERASRSARRDPRSLARVMVADRGWGASQFSCLVSLWNRESGWNHRASNPSSGAYGIPQSLPGSKMAAAGSDWRTNPATQIEWGLGYIADRYGNPCGAWAHSESSGWY